MEPKLSLQYSRGMQGGPFGVGWSLGGLSVVTRCGSTAATDGVRKGIKYNADDRFCLDGQRLILTNADGVAVAGQAGYGTAGTEYRTERDSYARVRAYGGTQATGPDSFKVWTKSGLVYEYGNSTNSRIMTTGSATAVPMAWAVNKVSDTTGNFMAMTYTQQANTFASSAGTEWNIAQIRYTGNGGQAPFNRIDFAYEDRPDKTEAFHEIAKSVNTRRMVSIRAWVSTNYDGTGGQTASMLKLGYAASPMTDRSLLAWVQQCGGDNTNKCLPRTEFTYTPGPGAGFAALPTNLTSQSLRNTLSDGRVTRGVYQGDFNGDGRQDLLVWDNDSALNTLLLSSGDGSFTASTVLASAQIGASNGCHYAVIADFNLDGISDVLQVSDPDALPECSTVARTAVIYLGSASGVFQSGIPVKTSQGQNIPLVRTDPTYSGGIAACGGTNQNDWACNGYTSANIYRSGRTFYVADIDGDGVPDILVTNTAAGSSVNPTTACAAGEATCLFLGSALTVGTYNKTTTSLAQSDLFSPRNVAMGRMGVPGTYAENRVFIGDLNSDGLPDIFVRDSGVRYIAMGTPGVFEQRAGTAAACLSGAEVLDVNGDGKWDMACMDYGKPGAYTAYANDGAGNFVLRGNVGTWTGAPECTPGPCDPYTYRGFITYLAADLDGDGISDILALGKSRYAGAGTWNSFLKGRRDGSYQTFPLALDNVELVKDKQDVLVGDFTGRGTVELLRYSDAPAQAALFARTDSVPPDLLATVKTPGNAVTGISYKPLTDSTVYTRSAGAVYPVVDFSGAQWVAATVNSPNGRGGSIATTFKYGGQRLDLSGRGALGFRTFEKTAPGPDGTLLTTRITNKQDFPYAGLPDETRRYVQSAGDQNWLSLSSSTYGDLHNMGCASGTSPRLYRPVLVSTTEQSVDLNGAPMARVDTTNADYTCFGDPGSVTVQTSNPQQPTVTYTKVTTNQYLAANTAGDNWITGRLSFARQANTVPSVLGAISSVPGTSATSTVTATVPTVSLTFTPNPVVAGQASTISWATTNATSGIWTCTGPTSRSGTFTAAVGTDVVLTDASFINNPLICAITASGTGGSKTASAALTVTPAPLPAVTLTFAPNPVVAGWPATVSWVTTNATAGIWTCTGPASRGGTFSSASGTDIVLTDASFAGNPLTCVVTVTGPGGDKTASAVLNATPAPTPTVSIGFSPASVVAGQAAVVSWTSTFATTGNWTCSGPTSRSGSFTNATGSDTVITDASFVGNPLTCVVTVTGPGGSKTASAVLTTTPAPQPTVSVGFSPNPVQYGQSSVVSWSSTGATAGTWLCTGPTNRSGSFSTPSGSDTVLTDASFVGNPLNCTVTVTGPGGSTTGSAVLTTTALAPTISAQFTPNPVAAGQTSIISWTSTNATSGTWSCAGPVSRGGSFTAATGSDSVITDSSFVGNPLVCTINVTGPGGNASVTRTLTTN